MEGYLRFLYDLVSDPNAEFFYETAMASMLDIEFIPYIGNDTDRALDGLMLRHLYGHKIDGIIPECTMLEMIIGLCMRLQEEFEDEFEDNTYGYWFSEIMNNLKIEEDCEDEDYIFEVVTDARDRRYDFNGNGGFFPLKHASRDQRKVEIWYQMSEYLMEKYPI